MTHNISFPESVGFDSKRLTPIKPIMQSYIDKFGYPGLSTLIARRGQVIHFEQVGWQERENHIPLSPDSIFSIYSMTKPVVCTAFMTSFEEGCFKMSDPLAKYIPKL